MSELNPIHHPERTPLVENIRFAAGLASEAPRPWLRGAAATTGQPAGRHDLVRWGWVELAVTLLLIAIFGTASVLLVGHVVSDSSGTALVINEAGRQRMRAQRMVRESLLVAVSTAPAERELHRRLLGEMRAEWRRVHEGLQHGDAELGLPEAVAADGELYAWLALRFERLDTAMAQLLAAAPEGTGNVTAALLPLVRQIADDADGFVEGMERVVLHYQRQAEALERRYRLFQAGALLASLLLALLALLVFRQFSRRIREAHEQLGAVNLGLQSEVERHRHTETARLRLAIAVEQAGESVVITDLDGVVQYANPAFERHTGFGREEIIGRNQRFLKSGEQGQGFYREFWSTIRAGKVWRGRMVNRRKDGELIVEEQTISPVRDESGTIVNFIGIKQDVTHAERLAERLRQAERLEAIGVMAGGIAHNLNNLLTPILGYSEIVASRLDPGGREREQLNTVIASALRARELIWQILLFSHKSEPARWVFALEEVVREVADQLRATIPPNVTIHADLPEGPALVDADPSQIHSLTLNLAVNAMQAMPGGGQLWLRVAPVVLDNEEGAPGEPTSGAYVRLEVEDTGTGIDAETLPRIFEPFFTTKGTGGTGLGLATVHGIVRQHGGHIAVESELGQGTRFRVHLPASGNAPAQPTVE